MTAAIKSLNKSNGKYGFNDLFSSVQSVGNVSKATDLIARYGKEANSKAVYNALVKAYGKENITSEMMAKIGYTAKNKTGKVGGGNTGIGFLNSAKELGSGVATVLSSIASYVIPMIITAVVARAGKKIWDNVITDNAAKEQLEKSSSAYKQAKSERDSLQSEYDSNKERIYELRAKANKSSEEQAELNKLENQNVLLSPQITTKDKIASTTQRQAAIDAAYALNKKSIRKSYR